MTPERDRPDDDPRWPSSSWPSTCWPAGGTPSPAGSGCGRRPAGLATPAFGDEAGGRPHRRPLPRPRAGRRRPRSTPISTLAAAAELVGVDLSGRVLRRRRHAAADSASTSRLPIDDSRRPHARRLVGVRRRGDRRGDRHERRSRTTATTLQLWPEHFDVGGTVTVNGADAQPRGLAGRLVRARAVPLRRSVVRRPARRPGVLERAVRRRAAALPTSCRPTTGRGRPADGLTAGERTAAAERLRPLVSRQLSADGPSVGEHGGQAAGVQEHDVGARTPASGRRVAEQAGEPLAAVRVVEHPPAVHRRPTGSPRRRPPSARRSPGPSSGRRARRRRRTTSRRRRRPAPASRSASCATSGNPDVDALGDADRQHSAAASSWPSDRSSARPATSPACVPPLDDVCTTAAGVMPSARHCSTSST